MKAIEYQHKYSSDTTEEQEMADLYGLLLTDADTSPSYEVEQTKLFRKDDEYFLLRANGCSCWDGDWDGWQFDKTELIAWALKQEKSSYRDEEDSDYLVAQWIKDNLVIDGTASETKGIE